MTDPIKGVVDTLSTRLTDARAARLDADVSSRSSHTAQQVADLISGGMDWRDYDYFADKISYNALASLTTVFSISGEGWIDVVSGNLRAYSNTTADPLIEVWVDGVRQVYILITKNDTINVVAALLPKTDYTGSGANELVTTLPYSKTVANQSVTCVMVRGRYPFFEFNSSFEIKVRQPRDLAATFEIVGRVR